ncbi:protein S100-A10b [Conger conger]|uniref:protein S100-A10b n=1 Tax=Conger conger TaxID=82655 RepID=UPI002A5AE72E|nr:protein S100-A10b [Conger conger]
MPSDLESSMQSLITVFHKYASKDGDQYFLSRSQFRTLAESELANFLKSQKDPCAVDTIMNSLDSNRDGRVDFNEYVSLVVGLSVACEQCFQMHLKQNKPSAAAKK